MDNLTRNAIHAALASYELPSPIEILPVLYQRNNSSVIIRTHTGNVRVKIYTEAHSHEALQYEHDLLHGLSDKQLSFTVPAPLKDRNGRTLQHSSLGWLALVSDLPGAELDPTALAEVESLGAALGELHEVLITLPSRRRPGRALFTDFFAFPPPEHNPLYFPPEVLGIAAGSAEGELLAWWHREAAYLNDFVQGPYRELPHQLCHNDPAPYNVLVNNGQVNALLDFEFAGLAPRGLDLVMALRMTMRFWENDDPWAAARHLCRGYARHARMTSAEIEHLGDLFLLRSSMGILWALGRGRPIDSARLLMATGFLQNARRWIDTNGAQLADLVGGVVC
jgi:Ser/Thr protein kinase RdoA (MazF antagonist)